VSKNRRKFRRAPLDGPQTTNQPGQPATTAVPTSHLELAIYIGLILAVLAVYAQVGHFSFVPYDDPYYVTENAHVRGGLTAANIKYALTAVVDSNWIPVTILSHMAVCDVFGMESGAPHWVNVILHALAAVVLFALLRHSTGALWPGAFVASVFAIHPLHVESVAWVAERKDVLSTLLWFLALYGYVRYTERPSTRRYLLLMVLFCLGLMAKPMLVTFPFTLLLFDVWPLRRAEFPRTLWEKLPLFALSLASSAVTYFAQRSGGAVQSVGLGESVLNALVSYVSYVGQTLWPTGLAVFYPYRQSIAVWQGVAASAVLLTVSAAAVITLRTRPYFATGWFWYLGTLVPVIGIIQVGAQSHADRYTYVPVIGLTMILAWGAADVVRKWPRAKAAVASAAVAGCVACLVMASAQTEYWRNGEALFQHAIDVTKNNQVAQIRLGLYLAGIPGRGAEAVSHYREALRINPDSLEAHMDLATYLLQTGHDAEAIPHYQAALRIRPDFAPAHFNLGFALAKIPGRQPDAMAQYEEAIHYDPDFAAPHKNLGVLLLELGRTTDAIAHFEAAQRIQPDPELPPLIGRLRAGQ
jgi:tetratricopeptide (TPR) repeat protein